MYNRYIPQPDGSYRRSRVQEQNRRPPQQHQMPKQEHPKQETPQSPPSEPKPCPRLMAQQDTKPGSVGNFLKQLLPKDFDTADLFIVLLLLLMAGDNQEEQSNALLTLALYLFM